MTEQIDVEVELVEESNSADSQRGRLSITALVRTSCYLPAQDENLPYQVEMISKAGGLQFMQKFFGLLMEKADLELVLSMRDGKEGQGIQRIGRRPYSFKTSFGLVSIKRIRVRHKADGSTEVPSSKRWKLPKQLCITKGLKDAVCQIVVKQSFSSTARQISVMAGEEKLISKSTVCNILHAEGQGLARANEERASVVYQSDESARRLLGRAETYLGNDFFEQVWMGGRELDEEMSEEEFRELLEEIEWDARDQIASASEGANDHINGRNEDEEDEPAAMINVSLDRSEISASSIPLIASTPSNQSELSELSEPSETQEISPVRESAAPVEVIERERTTKEEVIIQLDEVMVGSQQRGSRWLMNYGAVVNEGERKWYVSASSSTELLYQVGGLLSSLGVGDSKQLLVLSDGGSWIRRWIESVGIENKRSIICWYHLKKRCWRAIREAITNKEERLTLYQALMKYLWRGEVAEARRYLSQIIEDYEEGVGVIEMIDINALESLKEYLMLRQEHIPNYLSRVKSKQWIASTQIEKFNDYSVSMRCKKQNGMRWSQKGVSAIAALETARRNLELSSWRAEGKLPSWAEVLRPAA